jgi:hypothetical protein
METRRGPGNGERDGATIRAIASLRLAERRVVSRLKILKKRTRQTVPFAVCVILIACYSNGRRNGLKIEIFSKGGDLYVVA